MFEVPFDRLAHLVTVPVTLNGAAATFVLDSGIGLPIVRDTAAGWSTPGGSRPIWERNGSGGRAGCGQTR